MTVPKKLQHLIESKEGTSKSHPAPKGGAVDRMTGTEVKIKGGTHLVFKMGAPIHPMVSDIRYIFSRLYVSAYAKDVVPQWAVPEMLLKCSMGEMAELVPAVLICINEIFANNEFRTEDEYFLTVCAYILAWWYHLNGGGARPLVEDARQKRYERKAKIILTDPRFECPFCGKKWEPPKNMRRYTAMSKPYLAWLPKHFWEYHKWEQFNPSGAGPETPDNFVEPKRRTK
jgi:hypothetical protein